MELIIKLEIMCMILSACLQAGDFGLEALQKKNAQENREEKMRYHGKTKQKTEDLRKDIAV